MARDLFLAREAATRQIDSRVYFYQSALLEVFFSRHPIACTNLSSVFGENCNQQRCGRQKVKTLEHVRMLAPSMRISH